MEAIKFKTELKNAEQEFSMILLDKENKLREQEINLKNIKNKVERIVNENKEKD